MMRNKTTTNDTSGSKLNQGLIRLRTFMSSSTAWRLVLILFVLQATFLAFTMRIGTPPDETNHIQFIQFYSTHSLSPIFDQQQPTYNLGDKTREVDYLYHYVMSLVVRVLPLAGHAELVVIRLFSVLFGLLTMIVLAKAFRLLGLTAGVITGVVLLITNLPMVLMLSSAINNDVLVWLGMATGMLLLVRLWKKPSALDLLWLVNLSLLGGLVKRTFLPLGLAFGAIGLLICISHFRTIFASLKKFNRHLAVAVIVMLLGLALFTERVGGNVVHYGKIVVSCEEIHGDAACYNFWANVRERALAKQPPEKTIPPVEYVVRWFGESFDNIVDIQTQGWRHEVKPARFLTPTLVWMLVVGLAYGLIYELRRFKNDIQARWRVYIAAISLFFIIIQLLVNIATYKQHKVFGLALNGRYILPGLLPLVGFAWYYWANLLQRHPRIQILLAMGLVIFVLLGSGLLMMLHNPQLRLG